MSSVRRRPGATHDIETAILPTDCALKAAQGYPHNPGSVANAISETNPAEDHHAVGEKPGQIG